MVTRRYSLAAIVCCQCGTDYAREYWAMGAAADPNVCKSCRRDTNRDAADAPQGSAPVYVPALFTALLVSPSRKQCRVCRGEWDGLIFGPSASKGSPLPFGICPSCAAAEDQAQVPVVPVGVPLTLARPARALEGADD